MTNDQLPITMIFSQRHIGPGPNEIDLMLREVGSGNIDEFIDSVIPRSIRETQPLNLAPPRSESDVLEDLKIIASKNQKYRSLIGMGFYDTIVPGLIQRNILESPGWYTQYTPYQAEIAQGRLEALLNFQTMIIDLTGLEIANASLLDESTAAAEAMAMFYGIKGRPHAGVFFVSDACHPQTIEVVKTRAKPLGIRIEVGEFSKFQFSELVFGALLQYPTTQGVVYD